MRGFLIYAEEDFLTKLTFEFLYEIHPLFGRGPSQVTSSKNPLSGIFATSQSSFSVARCARFGGVFRGLWLQSGGYALG